MCLAVLRTSSTHTMSGSKYPGRCKKKLEGLQLQPQTQHGHFLQIILLERILPFGNAY